MRKFHKSIDIEAPPSEVWAVMRDIERWPEWTPTVRSARYLGSRSLAVGRRALLRQPKFPPAIWRVTELTEERGFTWVSGFPGMWTTAHHSIEPTSTGCRVSLGLRFDGVLGGAMGALTREVNAEYLELEAAGLKDRVEKAL